MSTLEKLAFVDAHAHLYDSRAVRYGIFDRRDPAFEPLVGDYSALPRTYLSTNTLRPRIQGSGRNHLA